MTANNPMADLMRLTPSQSQCDPPSQHSLAATSSLSGAVHAQIPSGKETQVAVLQAGCGSDAGLADTHDAPHVASPYLHHSPCAVAYLVLCRAVLQKMPKTTGMLSDIGNINTQETEAGGWQT